MTRLKRRVRHGLHGRPHVVYEQKPETYDPNDDIPDESADRLLGLLRETGCLVWLKAMPDWTLRTRMMVPSDMPPEVLEDLARLSRALAKAVARSGQWDPPPDNPWGDRPVPPGGRWVFE